MITTQRMGLNQMDEAFAGRSHSWGYPSIKSLLWKFLTLFAQSQDIHQEKQISIYRLISS